MDDQALKQFIIENLSEYEDPNDLILEICNRTGMKWLEAQALVDTVRAGNSSKIARKQAPLLTALALITFVAGVGILLFEGFTFINVFREFTSLGHHPWDVADLMLFVLAYAPGLLQFIPLALVMVLGSLVGMSDMWKAILFPDEPQD